MRLLSWILVIALSLTVLRWAVALGLVLILLAVVTSLFRAPGKTLAALFGWLLLCAFAAYPLAGLLLCSLALLCSLGSKQA